MNLRYGITHDGNIYTYEARAWNDGDPLYPTWYTQVLEWTTIDDDDGSGNYYQRRISSIVAPSARINRHIGSTNPTNLLKNLDDEFQYRNWKKLAGKPFLYAPGGGYWFAAMAIPNVALTGDTDLDGLMVRTAARTGTKLSIREFDEIRKANLNSNDPAILAGHITRARADAQHR